MSVAYLLLKHGITLTIALFLYAGYGPALIPVPKYPHVRIRDVTDDMISPPNRPYEGVLATNTVLRGATVLFNNTIQASETVTTLPDGRVLLMDKYAYVWLADPDSSAPGGFTLQSQPLIHLGVGRPLGFMPDRQGNVLVCLSGNGLVKLIMPDPSTGSRAKLELLGSRVSADSPVDPGTPILFANDLDITKDGSVVYFTDSQAVPVEPNWGTPKPWYDSYTSYLLGLFSGQQSGRLLAYYPHNGSIHVLAKGFWFANGVALSEDESYVLVAETNKFRLVRYWIKGEKAGSTDVFVDRIPGMPDSINRAQGGRGTWVSLPVERTGLFNIIAQHRIIRVALAYLPAALRPLIPGWGAAVRVSPEGEIVEFLQDPKGQHVEHLTSAWEQALPGGGHRLWLGSVKHHYVTYIDV